MCSCPLPYPSIHGHLKFQTKHGSSADDKEASDSRGQQTLGGETNRVCVCVYSVTESLILVSKGAGGEGILRESLPNNTLGVKLTPVRLNSLKEEVILDSHITEKGK